MVKSPLGVLWFGSPGQRGLPHGWGRPPAPLVVDGRMFILGNDFIRCVDVYNGRIRWETSLPGIGKPYSSPHYAGTNLVGSNWCASSDSVYVHDGRRCHRLSAVDGKIVRTYEVPGELGEKQARWGYIACTDELLFGTWESEPFPLGGMLGLQAQTETQGRALFALDTATGRLSWLYHAKQHIWRDTIALASGRMFLIDRHVNTRTPPGELVALDAKTGRVDWRTDREVFGNCLSVSDKHDVLLMAFPGPPGSPIRACSATCAAIAWPRSGPARAKSSGTNPMLTRCDPPSSTGRSSRKALMARRCGARVPSPRQHGRTSRVSTPTPWAITHRTCTCPTPSTY